MRSFLLAASALTILCGAAFAQTSNSGSTSGATVDTTSGSQSSSVSNPKVNVIGNPIGNGASSSTSGANSRSGSNSRSGAAASSGQSSSTSTGGRSSSTSAVTINNGSTGSTGATGAGSDGTTAAGTTSSGSYSGTQILRNTPEIVAPSIIGGNPCTVGMSGGVSLPGFGIVTGGSWEGKACERRQLAALLYNMGHDMSGGKGNSIGTQRSRCYASTKTSG